MIFQLVGGIGLFLLGMILLTDGLKSFAGDSLRRALLRFTGRPISAFSSGVVVTALVQSSSATTLATIGFVSAGLLTFPQAIGVLLGASLGTTSTGWMVSTLGLKFSIGTLALPLTGVGAFIKLLCQGKASSLGMALAGFGLIFIGIDTLQEGMRHLSEVFDLGRIPARGFGGSLLLMVVGIVMTVVMQSSSAAVATTLAALHAGAISFEHATALVIGQAIGTTVTAAFASIGASIPAKRTALAHVLFNLSTGLIALFLLPVFHQIFAVVQDRTGEPPGALMLAAFHTSFIFVGVLVFLPIIRPFARFVEKLLPENGPQLTRNLDFSLYSVPAVALEAASNALKLIGREQAISLRTYLDNPGKTEIRKRQEGITQALEKTRRFLAKVPLAAGEETTGAQRIALFHALDHLGSLNRITLQAPFGQEITDESTYELLAGKATEGFALAEAVMAGASEVELDQLQEVSQVIAAERRRRRTVLLEEVARGRCDPEETLMLLDWVRWLDSANYHLWRACKYLANGNMPTPDSTDRAPGAKETLLKVSE